MAFFSRFVPAIALLACAGAAQAQFKNFNWQQYTYFQAGLQTSSMSVDADPDHIGATGWMVGYRFNETFGVQAVGWGANSPFHQPVASDGLPRYDFTRFDGVEAVGYIPATQYWDIFGGLGIGRASYGTLQPGYGADHKTDGIVDGGIRWQIFRHLAGSTGVSRVFDAQSNNIYLRAEVDF